MPPTTTTTTKPRTPVPPPAAPRALALDDLLHVLVGPEPAGLLRFAARGGGADAEGYFRWTPAGYTWPGAQGRDRPADFIERHADAALGWSPLAFASPAVTGPVRVPVAWCAWSRTLVPHPAVPGYATVDPPSEAATVATVAALSPRPTVVLDDGRRLVALWRLTAPLSLIVADHVMTRLAVALGGDRDASVVWRTAAFPIPGVLAPGIVPARRVTATALGAAPVTLDDLGVAA
jgi:hypothetical protein